MRKLLYLLVLVTALLSVTGCKTNEANYRAAYERAIEGRNTDPDSTIYTKIRREMTYRDVKVAGDTVQVASQHVRITDGGGGVSENIKRYCVVAGQFKQLYTAKSMRERLVNNGYPGAFVVETREPYYYVVVAAYDQLPDAKVMLETIKADPTFKLKPPMPFVLNPSQIR